MERRQGTVRPDFRKSLQSLEDLKMLLVEKSTTLSVCMFRKPQKTSKSCLILLFMVARFRGRQLAEA